MAKNSRNLTMTWKIIREAIKGKKNDTANPLINTNRKQISNPQEIANLFNVLQWKSLQVTNLLMNTVNL